MALRRQFRVNSFRNCNKQHGSESIETFLATEQKNTVPYFCGTIFEAAHCRRQLKKVSGFARYLFCYIFVMSTISTSSIDLSIESRSATAFAVSIAVRLQIERSTVFRRIFTLSLAGCLPFSEVEIT